MSHKPLPLTNETLMYSVHRDTGEVVIHHFPWERGNPMLEYYVKKGFTFERPPDPVAPEPVVVEKPDVCDICGFGAKTHAGLINHKRVYHEKKRRRVK